MIRGTRQGRLATPDWRLASALAAVSAAVTIGVGGTSKASQPGASDASHASARAPAAVFVPITPPGHGGIVLAAAGCKRHALLVMHVYESPYSERWCGQNESWELDLLSRGGDSFHAHYDGRSECITALRSDHGGAKLGALPCNPNHPSPRQRFGRPRPASHGRPAGTYYIPTVARHHECIARQGRGEGHARGSAATQIALRRCGQTGTLWAIPEAPTHTETWALDDSATAGWCNGGYGASPELVHEWVTFAESNCGPDNTKALSDCHQGRASYCTVIQYFDANTIWSANPVFTAPASENWWLHQRGYTDRAHRLTDSSAAGTEYWLDQSNGAARRWVAGYIRSNYHAWDGLEMDSNSTTMKQEFYRANKPAQDQYRTSQELRTNGAVATEHRSLASMLRHPGGAPFTQVDNGISPNPYQQNTLSLLNHPSAVVGLISEGYPWNYGFSAFYPGLLDVMAAVDARPGDFVVLLSYAKGGPANVRLLQEATVLLGYKPGHVVSWEDLEQDNLHLAVWPEEGIYPTNPVESMSAPRGRGCLTGAGVYCSRGGHNDLLVASGPGPTGAGVYRREFRDCYYEGTWFGRCAAIVNDTTRAVAIRASWLRLAYRHAIVLRGGDVQSGGRLELAGAPFVPGRTTVSAQDAILLSQ